MLLFGMALASPASRTRSIFSTSRSRCCRRRYLPFPEPNPAAGLPSRLCAPWSPPESPRPCRWRLCWAGCVLGPAVPCGVLRLGTRSVVVARAVRFGTRSLTDVRFMACTGVQSRECPPLGGCAAAYLGAVLVVGPWRLVPAEKIDRRKHVWGFQRTRNSVGWGTLTPEAKHNAHEHHRPLCKNVHRSPLRHLPIAKYRHSVRLYETGRGLPPWLP